MLFDKLLDRLGRKGNGEQPVSSPPALPPADVDGRVELQDGRLIVHDPVGNGRFATLLPVGGIRLWINGVETEELAVVTAADEIHWETDSDGFFHLAVADDGMAVTLVLTADPARLPDTVALEGPLPVRIRPGYSAQAPRRPQAARETILSELERLGVRFGVDERAIGGELERPTYEPVVVARGQEAQPADPGEWAWRLDGLGMVEPGQMIAAHQGGRQGQARITVTGESTQVFAPGDLAVAYTAGQGTRLLPGGRLVAAASGRARAVPDGTGASRVDVFPVHLVPGDLTTDLTASADIIVRGNIRKARVTTTGEVLVVGAVERSEINAAGIFVWGGVTLSSLYTMQPGHFAPLRGELGFFQRRVEELGDAETVAVQVKESWFKEAASFIGALREKADELRVVDPAFRAAIRELANHLIRSDASVTFNRMAAHSLSSRLNAVLDEAARASTSGDVRAKSMAQTQVWASRDIYVEENLVGCSLYAGGSVETPPTATSSQTEILAAVEVKLGVLASLRGTGPVTVRSRRIDAAEVQTGCVLGFGFEQKNIGADLFRVTCRVNNRGLLVIKQG